MLHPVNTDDDNESIKSVENVYVVFDLGSNKDSIESCTEDCRVGEDIVYGLYDTKDGDPILMVWSTIDIDPDTDPVDSLNDIDNSSNNTQRKFNGFSGQSLRY